VTFAGGEDETCVLSGFTIRNGKAKYGGGITAPVSPGSKATIRQNLIIENSAEHGGGGLYYCNGKIENNTISGNSATLAVY
jgi:hypothetical protein